MNENGINERFCDVISEEVDDYKRKYATYSVAELDVFLRRLKELIGRDFDEEEWLDVVARKEAIEELIDDELFDPAVVRTSAKIREIRRCLQELDPSEYQTRRHLLHAVDEKRGMTEGVTYRYLHRRFGSTMPTDVEAFVDWMLSEQSSPELSGRIDEEEDKKMTIKLSEDHVEKLLEKGKLRAVSRRGETVYIRLSGGGRTWDRRPLHYLDLPSRGFSALKAAGCATVGDVSQVREWELLRYRNVGKVTVQKIKAELDRHGLSLATE